MKKKIVLLLILFWAIPSCFAQLRTHTFEEVTHLSKENPKPIVVFVYTSWCTYCKMMENVTFKNKEIMSVLNRDFYFIPLDAETKEDIIFKNYRFQFVPSGNNTGVHELARALATVDRQISYPTITLLNTKDEIIFQKHSYINSKVLISILNNYQEETNKP